MSKKEEYIRKTITIRPDQNRYVEERFINLSRFVQKKLDETMGK